MEGRREELLTFSNLTLRCLKLNGRKRPIVKEVALELENPRRYWKQLSTKPDQQEGYHFMTESSQLFESITTRFSSRRLVWKEQEGREWNSFHGGKSAILFIYNICYTCLGSVVKCTFLASPRNNTHVLMKTSLWP